MRISYEINIVSLMALVLNFLVLFIPIFKKTLLYFKDCFYRAKHIYLLNLESKRLDIIYKRKGGGFEIRNKELKNLLYP